MSKFNNKKIVFMVNNIDNNHTKICFYESCIGVKIMSNSNIKPRLEVISKLDKLYIDL